MELFCKDKKLNISHKYLRPGFAYGGSCLPKDILGLSALSKLKGVDTPLLDGVMQANNALLDQALNLVIDSGYKKVVFIGLAFKEGTDDLRGSPYLMLAKKLEKLNLEIDYYDENLSKSIQNNVNKNIIIDQLDSLYPRLHENFSNASSSKDLALVGSSTNDSFFHNSALKLVIDLNGGIDKNKITAASIDYKGLNWN